MCPHRVGPWALVEILDNFPLPTPQSPTPFQSAKSIFIIVVSPSLTTNTSYAQSQSHKHIHATRRVHSFSCPYAHRQGRRTSTYKCTRGFLCAQTLINTCNRRRPSHSSNLHLPQLFALCFLVGVGGGFWLSWFFPPLSSPVSIHMSGTIPMQSPQGKSQNIREHYSKTGFAPNSTHNPPLLKQAPT